MRTPVVRSILRHTVLTAILTVALGFAAGMLREAPGSSAYAKRVTLRMKTSASKNKTAAKEGRCLKIERRHDYTAPSDSLFDRIVITGYDKTANAGKESFFVINNTGRNLAAIELEFLYLTLDGRQLHRCRHTLTRTIPDGETVKIDIKSWDTQHSFRYRESEAPKRRQAIVYDVRITPLSLSLYPDEETSEEE